MLKTVCTCFPVRFLILNKKCVLIIYLFHPAVMVDHLKLQQHSRYLVKVPDDSFCLLCGKNSWMLTKVKHTNRQT